MSAITRSWAVAVLLVAALTGCEEEKKPSVSLEDAGTAKAGPAIDPNIAKAITAASGQPAATAAPAGDEDGPPETGVFAPGVADQKMKAGAMPTVTLGSAGTEPLVDLGKHVPEPGKKQTLKLTVSTRQGRSAKPNIEFDLAIEALKPKAGEDPPADGAVAMRAEAKSVKLSATQPGQLPPEAKGVIDKLKGAKVSYMRAPNGAAFGFSYTIPKELPEGMHDTVHALGEALATISPALPGKPVGKGAYWMSTTREQYTGNDVVAYRMIKVEGVQGKLVTLSVGTKRYAANQRFEFPGLGGGAQLDLMQFAANGDARVVLQPNDPFPMSAKVDDSLQAVVSGAGLGGGPGGGPGAAGPGGQPRAAQIQTQTTVEVAR